MDSAFSGGCFKNLKTEFARSRQGGQVYMELEFTFTEKLPLELSRKFPCYMTIVRLPPYLYQDSRIFAKYHMFCFLPRLEEFSYLLQNSLPGQKADGKTEVKELGQITLFTCPPPPCHHNYANYRKQ